MKTRRQRTARHWSPRHTMHSSPAPRPSGTPVVPEISRTVDSEQHLGPYEDAYDIVLGYGFERAIVTP